MWFPVMLVPKLLLTPIRIRIFGPKTAKIGPKYAFLVILGQILAFFAHLVPTGCISQDTYLLYGYDDEDDDDCDDDGRHSSSFKPYHIILAKS